MRTGIALVWLGVSWQLGAGPVLASIGMDGTLPPPEVEITVNRPRPDLFRMPSERVGPETGLRGSTEPLLIILFKFKDTGQAHATTTAADWQRLAFGATSSMKDYYKEVSYANLDLTPAAESHGAVNDGVTGWYTSLRNFAQYGNNYRRIFADAVIAANPHVDYSSFDADEDGFISATELHIMVVAAANEQSYGGVGAPKVWASNWCLPNGPNLDGVTVADCDGDGGIFILGELNPAGQQSGLGIACHELGHQLGWPDLYDTDPDCFNGYIRTQGLGYWDLMASGSWLGDHSGNNDSTWAQSPAHPSAWCKAYRGWVLPTEVSEDIDNVDLPDAETNSVAYKLWTYGQYGGYNKEYFLVENRQQIGYDSALPGCGLLVYHVDEVVGDLDYDHDGTDNWDDNDLQWDYRREFIDLECADGFTRRLKACPCAVVCEDCPKDDLDVTSNTGSGDDWGPDCTLNCQWDNRGDGGDPFPGTTNNVAFGANSCPTSVDNRGSNTLVALSNIGACADTVSVDFDVGDPGTNTPDIWLKDCVADAGNEPSGCNQFWTSPDIWIDNNGDLIQDAPVHGALNRFWVKIRNRGNAPAVNVRAQLHYRNNSTGLAFPNGATFLAETFAGLVPAGGSVKVEMTATIPNPPVLGHWCFGVTLDCADDPVDVNAGLKASNSKACVNFGVLVGRAGQGIPGGFVAETPEDFDNPGPGDHMIDIEHDLPAGWDVLVGYRPSGTWLPYTPGTPFYLDGTPEHDVEFQIMVQVPPTPFQGQAGTVSVRQIFINTGQVMGGIEFPIYEDDFPPEAIADLTAERANHQPDEGPLELRVLLSWTPPELDTAGNPEVVHFYEIYRSTTAGFPPDPQSLIATSAMDEDLTTVGWQFVDGDSALAAGVTYYYNVIAVDRAEWSSGPSNEAGATPQPLLDLADHDVGNCILTMTDQGILGFLDGTQGAGSGFVFPAAGSNLLYIGGLWIGESATYVANRDYDDDPDREWVVATDPDGHVFVDEDGASDQDIHAGFTDGGAAQPRGLSVRQESWAFASPPDDEFVIVRYFIENQGQTSLDSIFVGTFLDVDVDPFGQNTGGSDAGRRLVYIAGGADLHVGARLLTGDPDPDPVGNLTLIHNPTYVYPQAHVLDADKFGFLSAAAPEYQVPSATEPDDYSLLASAGPITLAPGEINEVAVAIAGGDGLANLLASADRAQEVYAPTTGIGGPGGVAIAVTRLLPNTPNPFNPSTTIRFELAQAGRLRLAVYDVSGRLVRDLANGRRPAGHYALTWDGRDRAGRALASGIYFLRLEAGSITDSRRIVLLK